MNDIGYECCYCLLYFAKLKKKIKNNIYLVLFCLSWLCLFLKCSLKTKRCKKKKKRMKIPKGLLELEVQTIPMSKKKDEENLQTMIHKTLRQKN